MDTPEQPSLRRRQTDPVWLQDFDARTGYDARTRSGTVTFVKRGGIVYACTSRHILDGLKDPTLVPMARFPVLALGVDRIFINLAHMTAQGPVSVARAPGPDTEHAATDIALAPLDPSNWYLLTSKKAKTAIDLDTWTEPDWAKVRIGFASGYPDEHKKEYSLSDIDYVGSQLITVTAEIASNPDRNQRTITLSSALHEPHSWYFSGLSGGTLHVAETSADLTREIEDENTIAAGIVFEGFPSSGRPEMAGSRDTAISFLGGSDLFIRALALTPAIFDEWVRDCGFEQRPRKRRAIGL